MPQTRYRPWQPTWGSWARSALLDIVSHILDTAVVGRTSAHGRSNAVRAARRAAGLTQAELAERAGVSRQTVVAVEAGDYAPSVYLALSLARHLDSTVEALFDVELEPLDTAPPGGSS